MVFLDCFRKGAKLSLCILCNRTKEHHQSSSLMKNEGTEFCQCPYVSSCLECKTDEMKNLSKQSYAR